MNGGGILLCDGLRACLRHGGAGDGRWRVVACHSAEAQGVGLSGHDAFLERLHVAGDGARQLFLGAAVNGDVDLGLLKVGVVVVRCGQLYGQHAVGVEHADGLLRARGRAAAAGGHAIAMLRGIADDDGLARGHLDIGGVVVVRDGIAVDGEAAECGNHRVVLRATARRGGQVDLRGLIADDELAAGGVDAGGLGIARHVAAARDADGRGVDVGRNEHSVAVVQLRAEGDGRAAVGVLACQIDAAGRAVHVGIGRTDNVLVRGHLDGVLQGRELEGLGRVARDVERCHVLIFHRALESALRRYGDAVGLQRRELREDDFAACPCLCGSHLYVISGVAQRDGHAVQQRWVGLRAVDECGQRDADLARSRAATASCAARCPEGCLVVSAARQLQECVDHEVVIVLVAVLRVGHYHAVAHLELLGDGLLGQRVGDGVGQECAPVLR